jgi:hypothetical protein
MKVPARSCPVALAIVTVLPIGLGSCTPAATPLKCTASVSAARPVQNTRETVTVKTVAGAEVITSARYKTNTATVTTLSNAHGAASTAYNVGAALTSFKVNVTATVVKGIQHATCATSFIPAAPALKVLTGTLSSSTWNGTNAPRTIRYVSPSSGACDDPHQGDGANPCGEWQPIVTVSGFTQYGGAPSGVGMSGSVDISWSALCLTDGHVHSGEAHSGLTGRWNAPLSARSEGGDSLSFPLDAVAFGVGATSAGCAGDLIMVSETASAATFHFDGGNAYPVLDFSARGPWS